MIRIFNIKKPSSSVPNVSTAVDDLSQSKGLEKDINDPGLDVSCDVNDLDLGDLDSGPRRPILKYNLYIINIILSSNGIIL